MQSQPLDLKEVTSEIKELENIEAVGNNVPGQIPQMPEVEEVPTRERILSISAENESFRSSWQRRIWCFIHFLKKIRPFGKRKEEIYIVKN